jgi:hypothetical protein
MAVHCVRLPAPGDSDSSSGDLFLPPVRHVAPQRIDSPEPSSGPEVNPFEVPDDPPPGPPSIDYQSLGLPPLSFDSDPFRSPVDEIHGIVTRHKVWIGGFKGLKFSFAIQDTIVLVAKRRREVKEESYLISRSSDYSLDTPDFAGLVIRQRGTSDFTVLSARERQSDGGREALAGLRLAPDRTIVIGTDVWLPQKVDSIFAVSLSAENSYPLNNCHQSFSVVSVKNAAFGRVEDPNPLFVAEKQSEKTLTVTVRRPLCLLQGFGLAIALFAQ